MIRKLLYGLLLSFPICALGQTVQTILDSTLEIDDALILDKAGNLYGSNFDGDAVYKLTPTGQLSVFANGFNTPNGLAFDSSENLFVLDPAVGRVYKISYAGVHLDTFYVPGASGIVKQLSSDTMYVAAYTQQTISKLAPDGTIIPWKQGAPLNGPVGFTYDDNGQLYVGNFTDRKILRLAEDTIEYIATVPGNSNGSGWLGFITYGNGLIYGTSFNTHKIYQVYPNYKDSVALFAGSTPGTADGPIQQAQFRGPNGIVASPTGDTIYVSDYHFGRVRMITGVRANMSIHEMSETAWNAVKLYPNPAQSQITLEWTQSALRLKVFDGKGQLHHSRFVEGLNTHKLEIANWPKGVYTFQLESQQGTHHQKLVIH